MVYCTGVKVLNCLLRRVSLSMRSGVVGETPAVVGRARTDFRPRERCQSTRVSLVAELLRLPHDQVGDRFPLAQLVPVLQNRVVWRCDPVEIDHTFRFFGSGLNSIWPPGASGSDFPFWKVISLGLNVTRPVIVWAMRPMGVQVSGAATV